MKGQWTLVISRGRFKPAHCSNECDAYLELVGLTENNNFKGFPYFEREPNDVFIPILPLSTGSRISHHFVAVLKSGVEVKRHIIVFARTSTQIDAESAMDI